LEICTRSKKTKTPKIEGRNSNGDRYQGTEQQWQALGAETREVYKAVLHLLNSSGELMANKDIVELDKAYQSMLGFKSHAENVMIK